MPQAKYKVIFTDGTKKTIVLNLTSPLHHYGEEEIKAEVEQQTDYEILREDIKYVSQKPENEY
jgi:hypothetical protein